MSQAFDSTTNLLLPQSPRKCAERLTLSHTKGLNYANFRKLENYLQQWKYMHFKKEKEQVIA